MNQIFEAHLPAQSGRKPTEDSDFEVRSNFCLSKYGNREFYSESIASRLIEANHSPATSSSVSSVHTDVLADLPTMASLRLIFCRLKYVKQHRSAGPLGLDVVVPSDGDGDSTITGITSSDGDPTFESTTESLSSSLYSQRWAAEHITKTP